MPVGKPTNQALAAGALKNRAGSSPQQVQQAQPTSGKLSNTIGARQMVSQAPQQAINRPALGGTSGGFQKAGMGSPGLAGRMSPTIEGPRGSSTGSGNFRFPGRTDSGAPAIPGIVGPAVRGGGDGSNAAQEEPKSELDQLYDQMIESANNQWSTTEQLNQANMAALSRRAQAMQGEMGRSVGGGFAQAMGGAYLQGMDQMNQARAAHEQAMNQLQLNYLTQKQNEQWKEKQWDREELWRKEDRLSSMEPGDVAQMIISGDESGGAAAAYAEYVQQNGLGGAGSFDTWSPNQLEGLLNYLLGKGYDPMDYV